jgi:hypothetical protein
MNCEDKIRLVQEYEVATATFAKAVRHLKQSIGTSTQAEYQHLQLIADEGRLKSEQARLAFELHSATHKC